MWWSTCVATSALCCIYRLVIHGLRGRTGPFDRRGPLTGMGGLCPTPGGALWVHPPESLKIELGNAISSYLRKQLLKKYQKVISAKCFLNLPGTAPQAIASDSLRASLAAADRFEAVLLTEDNGIHWLVTRLPQRGSTLPVIGPSDQCAVISCLLRRFLCENRSISSKWFLNLVRAGVYPNCDHNVGVCQMSRKWKKHFYREVVENFGKNILLPKSRRKFRAEHL